MADEYESPLAKYALHAAAGADSMGLGETLAHGVVATVVDAGTTLWNSLTPQSMEADTADLLSRIDDNALKVYNEHTDAVQMASFFVGSAAPIGLALKGMNLLRAGSKSVNWFSQAGREANLSKVRAAFEGGVGNTEKVKQAQRMVYKASALNALADNVAAEVAIMGAMSSHPIMEDYFKDLGPNFLLNMAIGGAIGGIGGHIIARKAVTDVKMGVEKEAVSVINSITKPADPAEHAGIQLQQRMQNVKKIQATLEAADSVNSPLTLSTFTKEHLKNIKLMEEAKAVETFQMAATEELAVIDAATQGSIRKLLEDPRFAGFDKIRLLDVSSSVPKNEYAPKTGLQKAWDFVVQKPSKKADVEVKPSSNEGVYSPVWKGFVGKNEAHNYATIADLGKSIEYLEKTADKQAGMFVRADAGIMHSINNTAEVEADFASSLLWMQSKKYEDLVGQTLAVAPNDLASMKAVYLRLAELSREGNDISKIKLVLTTKAPEYGAIQRLQAARAGFSSKYLDEIAAIDSQRMKYTVFDGTKNKGVPGLSPSTLDHLDAWVYGSSKELRKAALHESLPMNHITGVPQINVGASESALKALKEVRNHPNSVALRQHLSNISDMDGYVLMYRGMKTDPTGHHALESYTLNLGKAASFAENHSTGLRMYKVHVDDVVGMLEDIGEKGFSNMEILVMRSAARESAVVSPKGPIPSRFFSAEGELLDTAPRVTEGSIAANFSELADSISKSTNERIKELQAMGMGFETIALRTGTPVETVKEIITSGAEFDASALIKFGDRFAIEEALSPTNRALVLGTNMNKVPSAEMQASLNASTFNNMGQKIVEWEILSSKSSFVRESGEQILSDEARIQLAQIEKSVDDLLGYGVGNTMFRSANAVLERLGPVGELITGYGKQLVTIKNLAKERFTTPLSQSLSTVAKNDAHIIELSNAINFQAAVSGKKLYKAGQFWKYKAGTESVDSLIGMSDEEFLAYARSVDKNGNEMMDVLRGAGEVDLKIAVPEVDAALKQIQSSGREMYHLKNTSHRALGKGNLSDIGFWVPANNPRGKQIAYAFDKITGETKMLMARTPTELNSFIERFKSSLGEKAKTTDIITKAQQADYNRIAGRHDPMYMAVADASKQHGGASAMAELATTPDYLADIIQGYDHYINRGIDDLARIQLNPLMDKLDNMSAIHQVGYSGAALSAVEKGATKSQDPGNVIKNILMGRSNLEEHEGWMAMQSGMQMVADRSLRFIAEIVAPITAKGIRTEADWLKVQAEMEAKGIVNPFHMFIKGQEAAVPDVGRLKQAYLSQTTQSTASLTPRAVALMNAYSATAVLRFMDLAQPLVNMLSLPILTSGAVNKQLASSYAGAALDPTARFSTVRAMYDGVALMHSVHGEKWLALAEQKALLKDDWRTVNGIFKDIRSLEPGVMSKAESLLDSKVVELMSKPADYSEQLVRKVSFFTGVAMAKRAYPTLGDGGVITFARTFMDEAVGNYAAAQRPAMFQGTVGTAMGLFQTYMLTMAQRLFRQVETRDWKAMAKMMLTQQTIFGTASLPGFHPISELIGARYSDDNFDITSSTFRAFDDKTAEMILYGMPSQLVGVNTRGDIQPRIPLSEGLSSILPAANLLSQAVTAGNRLAQAAFHADENGGKAMLEALSMQSLSRPIARWSELALGHSMTSTGKVVSTEEDVYTPTGVLSRVFATRPIEEIKMREAMHLDTFYGSIDNDKRKKLTYRLKSHLTNGTLDQGVLEELAYEYMRTGTPTGWRAAVNEAIAQTSRTGSANVREHLSKNSALINMMDDLD